MIWKKNENCSLTNTKNASLTVLGSLQLCSILPSHTYVCFIVVVKIIITQVTTHLKKTFFCDAILQM